MGKGKGLGRMGGCDKAGRVLYEMDGVAKILPEAFRLAAHKLPISTRLITREFSMKAKELRDLSVYE